MIEIKPRRLEAKPKRSGGTRNARRSRGDQIFGAENPFPVSQATPNRSRAVVLWTVDRRARCCFMGFFFLVMQAPLIRTLTATFFPPRAISI